MTSIPITFRYQGSEYSGELSQVQGAGSTSVYHLLIDIYYKGRLRISAFNNHWIFGGEFADLAEGFGGWTELINWIKLHFSRDEYGLIYASI